MTDGQDLQRRDEARRRERRREVLALPVLPVRHHAPVTAAEDGDVLVCASVGPVGEVIAVWSAAEDLPVLTSGIKQGTTVYPDPRVSRTVTARVSVHAPDIVSVACLTGPGLAAFTVQPLPGGNILLVGPRPQRHPEILPRNAVVYDAGGHVRTEEALGDGIQHVLADSTGAVWVGYSDEAVLGTIRWAPAG